MPLGFFFDEWVADTDDDIWPTPRLVFAAIVQLNLRFSLSKPALSRKKKGAAFRNPEKGNVKNFFEEVYWQKCNKKEAKPGLKNTLY